MNETDPHSRIIVALDVPGFEQASRLFHLLEHKVGGFKLGLEAISDGWVHDFLPVMATTAGSKRYAFWDGKLDDIPATVKKAVLVTLMRHLSHGLWAFNVHASAGFEAMKGAVDVAQESSLRLDMTAPLTLAVTVLTSMDYDACYRTGLFRRPGNARPKTLERWVRDLVIRRALLAQEAGCSGVVCSPQEVFDVRQACGEDFVIVTPGVRLAQAETHDQQRVGTPRQAIADGTNYLVVGRNITEAEDVVVMADVFASEIALGLADRVA